MADDAARSLEKGDRLFNEGEPQTLADGARTRSVGARNWIRIKRRVSHIVRVSEESICRAMCLLHSVGVEVVNSQMIRQFLLPLSHLMFQFLMVLSWLISMFLRMMRHIISKLLLRQHNIQTMLQVSHVLRCV